MDWKTFRHILDNNIKINNKMENSQELENAVNNLTSSIQNAMSKTIRKVKANNYTDKLPSDITELIKKKNKIRKIWQNTRQIHIKKHFTNLTNIIKRKITQYRYVKWENKLKNFKPKDNSLWKMTKMFKRPFKPIPTLQDNNTSAFTDKEKAETLADHFFKAYTLNTLNNTQEQEQIIKEVVTYMEQTKETGKELYKYSTSPKEIINIIRKLPSLKAPGPAEIQNLIIKNLSKKAIVQIMYIINNIIKLKYFPQQWKIAHVIPLQKPGKPGNIAFGYRSISLLPTLTKVTEKIILQKLKNYKRKQEILINEQFGFRQKHNTTQQVLRITNDIITGFNKDKVTTMCCLTLRKRLTRFGLKD
ncbi:unnamed protein product [Xylocopa violacea]|uniref:Reverse transcriptase domain-containing protein n=1 Tax=Xylocopa violacea TaxID=135666 RepID=A0ABP1N8R3_XYLVO